MEDLFSDVDSSQHLMKQSSPTTDQFQKISQQVQDFRKE